MDIEELSPEAKLIEDIVSLVCTQLPAAYRLRNNLTRKSRSTTMQDLDSRDIDSELSAEQQRNNLYELANLLDAVQAQRADNLLQPQPARRSIPKHFSLTVWACGTSACAIGYATFYVPFNKLGFGLDVNYGDFVPTYKLLRGWAAVHAFFGLTGEAARSLFDTSGYSCLFYVTPLSVATNIRSYLSQTAT